MTKREFARPVCLAAALIAFGIDALAEDGAGFRWVDNPKAGTADVMLGDAPVLRYMYAYDTSTADRTHETYKVFHHVFGPNAKTIITKGPRGKYTHHRGLFIGWNRTRTKGASYDFWHCTKGAHQRHVKFLEKKADRNSATMTALIHWNDAAGKPVIKETRSVRVSKSPRKGDAGYGWQIDWSTTLSSNRGTILLSGDRQHAGFQFRAAQRIAVTNGARYIRPAGFPQQPQAFQVNDKGNPPKHINLKWFAMSFELEKKTFTVEYFEDPSLPKPSLFSERPYGRFGAYFKTTLTEGKPFTMRYRIRVTAGKPPERDDIQTRYNAFVAGLKKRGSGK